MKNIILCGFMGCGKSTVGKALAPLLNMKFIDMDKYIEGIAKQSVSDIFKNYGEKHFRELEAKAAKELSSKSGLIIATGGGAVLSAANVEAFKSGGIIVLIDVPLSVIAKRLDGDISRPLLRTPDKDDVMLDLYNKRMPQYRAAADFTVINEDDRPETTVAEDIARIVTGKI